MPAKGQKKRTPLEVEDHRRVILHFHAQRFPLREIQKELKKQKINLSHEQVRREIKAIEALWQEKNVRNMDAIINADLARLDILFDEAVQAWHKSKGTLIKRKTVHKTSGAFPGTDTTVEKIEMFGDHNHLRNAKDCLTEKHRLLGTYKKEESPSDGPKFAGIIFRTEGVSPGMTDREKEAALPNQDELNWPNPYKQNPAV